MACWKHESCHAAAAETMEPDDWVMCRLIKHGPINTNVINNSNSVYSFWTCTYALVSHFPLLSFLCDLGQSEKIIADTTIDGAN